MFRRSSADFGCSEEERRGELLLLFFSPWNRDAYLLPYHDRCLILGDFVQVELLNPLNGDSLAAVKTVGAEATDSGAEADPLVALHLFSRQASDSM
jgi:hypothetical protein